EDHLDVRAEHEHAGDPGAPGRYLWYRGIAHPDLQCDGSDRGGSKNLAEPAAGGDVSHRVSGRHDGQDAGQRTRAEPGDLCGAGGGSRGAEGSPGTVGGAAGGGQVLAASADRAEEPWGEGYLHRLRGWAERISRGHRSSLSPDRSAAVHRTSGAGVAELCALEVSQVGGGGSAANLSSGHGGRSAAASGGDDAEVDGLSQRGPSVATKLGADHAVFSLSGRHSQGDLHHQQRGGIASFVAQDY